MARRFILMLIVLGLVFGGLLFFNLYKAKKIAEYFENFEMPPVTISTVKVEKTNWQPTLESVGTFVAEQGVDVNAQQPGIITKIYFKSGQYVEKGAALIQLNDEIDQANLKKAQATLSLAELNFKRQQSLFNKAATSASSLDEAKSSLLQAKASVQEIDTIIKQKQITAPFTGQLGVKNVNIGEYVSPGNTKIVNLQSQAALYLQFYLPEQYLSKITRGQPIVFNIESYNNGFLAKVETINPQVDSATHNILVQAVVTNCVENKQQLMIDNQSQLLGQTVIQCTRHSETGSARFTFLPGMFAKVHVLLPQKKEVLTIPRTAVSYSLYGNSVYVIKKKQVKDKTYLLAHQQFIHTGEERATRVVVTSGLSEHDEIVDSGQLKLHNDTKVKINNSIKLKPVDNVDALGQ